MGKHLAVPAQVAITIIINTCTYKLFCTDLRPTPDFKHCFAYSSDHVFISVSYHVLFEIQLDFILRYISNQLYGKRTLLTPSLKMLCDLKIQYRHARCSLSFTKKEEWIVEQEGKVEIKGQGKETGEYRRKEDVEREMRSETEGIQR